MAVPERQRLDRAAQLGVGALWRAGLDVPVEAGARDRREAAEVVDVGAALRVVTGHGVQVHGVQVHGVDDRVGVVPPGDGAAGSMSRKAR